MIEGEQPGPFVTVLKTEIVTFVPQQASEAEGGSKDQLLLNSATLLLAQTMSGGVVSTVITVWLRVTLVEEASVACQVRLASNVPAQCPAELVTVPRTVNVTLVPLQELVKAGGSKSHAEPHSTSRLEEQTRVIGTAAGPKLIPRKD